MADTQVKITLDGNYDLTDNTETYDYEVSRSCVSVAYQIEDGNAKVFMADSTTDNTNVNSAWLVKSGYRESKDGQVAYELRGKYLRFYAVLGTPVLYILPVTGGTNFL